MSYKYSFADNETYNAEDINNITRRLISEGIEDSFTNGIPYNLSKFNDLGSLLYTSGVVPETDDTLKVIKINENTVRILPGTAFFDSGAVIEITGDGHNLSFEPGVKNYVFLQDDLYVSNTCFPACKTVEPSGRFKLCIAEITETGTVIDKRIYARGKLAGYASNDNYRMQISDVVSIENSIPKPAELRYHLGNNNYQYLMFFNHWDKYTVLGVYNLASGETISFASYTIDSNGMAPTHSTKKMILWHSAVRSLYGQVSNEDGELVITLEFSEGPLGSYSGDVPVTMYLF